MNQPVNVDIGKKSFTKLKLPILFIAVILLVALTPAVAMAAISFPDPNLEAVVRSTINKPTGDIEISMVQKVTELDASGKGIRSIEGLQYFTNLQVAWLYDNEISDITPLRGLTKLNTLGLCNDHVSDISALSGLTQLTFLSLYNNQVRDISALANLNKLTTLKLANDPITDYSPVYDIYNQLKVKDFKLPATAKTTTNTVTNNNSATQTSNVSQNTNTDVANNNVSSTDTGQTNNSVSNSETSVNTNQPENADNKTAVSDSLNVENSAPKSNSGKSTIVIILICLCLAIGIGWLFYKKTTNNGGLRSGWLNNLFVSKGSPVDIQQKEDKHEMPNIDFSIPFEAYSGNKPYIFVSYAHVDGSTVFNEITELHRRGYRIWYDEGIDPGNEWPVEIAKALEAAACFLVFISEAAINSQNVRNEINFALSRGKPFFAIYLNDIKLPPGLELRMGDIQAILKWRMTQEQYLRKIEKALSQDLIEP